MAEPALTGKYPVGSRPEVHFLPYLIVISYLVSLVGSVTTVELLHRRISRRGWQSWVQLSGCSISFGLVAIWCMHFVGNRAIILGDGEEEIQLYYNATYTAISAILPIAVIFIGLTISDHFYRGHKTSITRFVALLITAILCGAAITAMHYLGNTGTTDYHVEPQLPYIIGATLIAIGACLIAFGLFFHWSVHWMDSLWRRFLVSCFLAMAVSGMHWTAAAGTSYQLQGYHIGPRAKNTNLIIAICLSLAACMICFALGFLKQRRERKLRERAQQVVLAAATFDEEGRLLVTQGGLLPCQTITRQFHQRTFDEDFNTTHPVFQWLFRVSRNWAGIVDLVPGMRDHLLATGCLQTNSPVIGSGTRSSIASEDNPDYSATFRELFCVTAQDIARSLDTKLQDLGCLYEEVLPTGTLLKNMKTVRKEASGNKTIIAADVAVSQGDIESGLVNPILFGKGQLLIITRVIESEEASRLQNLGFRFASLDQVGNNLASSLQISMEDLQVHWSRLQLYCIRKPWVYSSGSYLAAFLLQPSPVIKGLDVVVPRYTPDRLPMVQLSSKELKPWQVKLLKKYDGMTLDECVAHIVQRYGAQNEDEGRWLEKLRNKIVELTKEVPEPILRRAIFSAQEIKASQGNNGSDSAQTATVFAFCAIKEVYNQALSSKALRYIPLSFFQCQQRAYSGAPDHAILARNNHTEFSTILNRVASDQKSLKEQPFSRWNDFWRLPRASTTASEVSLQPDNSSEKGLVNISQNISNESTSSPSPLGGIMVSQDIIIHDSKDSCQVEMSELGIHSHAGLADREEQTMADQLLAITTTFQARDTRHTHNRR